ncbi:MAG TPA: hypothetical protein DCY55_10540 [Gammaproteobacteria bacterium]|nr:hypothetical protein [Gammaproteobacteria bacterium]
MMKIKSILPLLLSALLLSQTAIAQHDIEHQFLEHTELCAVFVTADEAGSCELPLTVLAVFVESEVRLTPLTVEVTSLNRTAYLSRAPPLA